MEEDYDDEEEYGGDEYDEEVQDMMELDDEDLRRMEAKDLLANALACVEAFQPEHACRFFEKALDLEPKNTDIMDEYADVLLSIGNVPKALRLLQNSVEIAPESSYAKYMNLAQLMEGLDSVQCYERGAALIRRDLQQIGQDDKDQVKALRRELSAALVSLAEMYMTDLCYESDAEQRCERYVKEALEVDPEFPDAYHTMASFRISQQKPEMALEVLRKGYALWKPPEEKELNMDVLDDDEDDDDNDEEMMDVDDGNNNEEGRNVPEFASRLAAGKMFLELGDGATACDIFNDLIMEDEDDPELPFLLALATDDPEERTEMLQEAVQKMEKAEKAGQSDLQHLKAAIENAVRNNNLSQGNK